jgi:hypothetical protein
VARGRNEFTGRVVELLAAAAATVVAWAIMSDARAASFAPKDLQVLGRAAAFMQPAPAADSFVAIAYMSGNAASRADAEAIAAQIGAGLQAGRAVLRPRVIDIDHLNMGGFQIVIAAAGANGPLLSAAARAARALCVTTEIEAVRAGLCAMAISSEPRVEIVVNHAVSAAAGIEFAPAFRMMIREM